MFKNISITFAFLLIPFFTVNGATILEQTDFSSPTPLTQNNFVLASNLDCATYPTIQSIELFLDYGGYPNTVRVALHKTGFISPVHTFVSNFQYGDIGHNIPAQTYHFDPATAWTCTEPFDIVVQYFSGSGTILGSSDGTPENAYIRMTDDGTFSVPPVDCTSYVYGEFGMCTASSTQERVLIESLPSGCTIGGLAPTTTQACTYEPPLDPLDGLSSDFATFVLFSIYVLTFWSAVGVIILFVRRK